MSDVSLASAQAPSAQGMGSEGSETEGRGHRNVKVPAGPDRGSKQSTGLARVALEAQAHCPRPEGSFPEEMTTLFAGAPCDP